MTALAKIYTENPSPAPARLFDLRRLDNGHLIASTSLRGSMQWAFVRQAIADEFSTWQDDVTISHEDDTGREFYSVNGDPVAYREG